MRGSQTGLGAAAAELQPRLIEWRRHLHRHPEPSFEEFETSQWIRMRLGELGLPFENPIGTSVVAQLEGRSPGRTVAIRADIDALPIEELGECEYRSTRPGLMHACGHDGHTAMLMGVAHLLATRRDFDGRILLVFQSGEEKPPGGALQLIEVGALDGIDHVIGLHLLNRLPAGRAALRTGPAAASVDSFEAVICGRAGHGAHPHHAIDAVLLAAQCIVNLQTIVSRRVSPLESAVVSVGYMHAGTAFNTLPGVAKIGGTVRALAEAVREQCAVELQRTLHHTCAMAGGSVQLEYLRGYPSLVNHPLEASVLRAAAVDALGEGAVSEIDPSMGGDDFAHLLERWPGAYLILGAGNLERGLVAPHHSPEFNFDESVLCNGTEILARASLRLLDLKQAR